MKKLIGFKKNKTAVFISGKGSNLKNIIFKKKQSILKIINLQKKKFFIFYSKKKLNLFVLLDL